MGLDFSKTQSRKIVDEVMGKANETDLNDRKIDIPLDLIDLNVDNEDVFGYQDIEHLASRIKLNGFTGAIEVYAKKNGRYEISSGHRRYLACKSLGMEKIPCIVSYEVGEVEKAKKLIESNIHNRTMTPYRWAKAMDYYAEHVIKPTVVKRSGNNVNVREMIAEVFGVSSGKVQRYLSILRLIPEFQKLADDENFPTTIFFTSSLYRQTKEDQEQIYKELVSIVGEDGIAGISGEALKAIVNGYLQKKEKLSKEPDGRATRDLATYDSTHATSRDNIETKKEDVVMERSNEIQQNDIKESLSSHQEIHYEPEEEEDFSELHIQDTEVKNNAAEIEKAARDAEAIIQEKKRQEQQADLEEVKYHIKSIEGKIPAIKKMNPLQQKQIKNLLIQLHAEL